jgi:hypothetical protein
MLPLGQEVQIGTYVCDECGLFEFETLQSGFELASPIPSFAPANEPFTPQIRDSSAFRGRFPLWR